MLLLKLFILVTLGLIFIQDLKSRAVYWWLFLVLILLFLAYDFLASISFELILYPTLVNIILLALQFALLTLYFSIKNSQLVNLTDGFIGLGDLLFLFAIAFYLSPISFIFFYTGSLSLIAVSWFFWLKTKKNVNKDLPLAGFQAILLAVLMTGDWWFKTVSLTNDNWFFALLNR